MKILRLRTLKKKKKITHIFLEIYLQKNDQNTVDVIFWDVTRRSIGVYDFMKIFYIPNTANLRKLLIRLLARSYIAHLIESSQMT